MLTPVCTWLTSLVMRVIMVEVPISSISREGEGLQFAEEAGRRSSAEQPTAARAAKNCPAMEKAHPTSPMPTSTRHMRAMNGLIPLRDAPIDDEGDDEGGDEFEARLQELEEGREDALRLEAPETGEKMFQNSAPKRIFSDVLRQNAAFFKL